MLPQELDKSGIVNNDYIDVVFGRRAVRMLDPDFKIERSEIEQMIQEAIVSTPSAVDTQPFMFLIVDTDEGKAKLNDIMRIVDKDRVNKCSFAVVPFADRNWFEYFDEHIAREKQACPEGWPPEVENVIVPLTYDWYVELSEGDGSYLDKSVNFQAGMVSMSFQNAVRAHGYDCGVMDSWDPQLLGEAFGIDLDRYIPQVAIAVGKKLGGFDPARYRYPANEKIVWG